MALKICYSTTTWKMTFSSVELVVVGGALVVGALPYEDDSDEAGGSSYDEAAGAYSAGKTLCSDSKEAPCHKADCDEASASSDTCDEEAGVDSVAHPCSLHHRIQKEVLSKKNCSWPYSKLLENGK